MDTLLSFLNDVIPAFDRFRVNTGYERHFIRSNSNYRNIIIEFLERELNISLM